MNKKIMLLISCIFLTMQSQDQDSTENSNTYESWEHAITSITNHINNHRELYIAGTTAVTIGLISIFNTEPTLKKALTIAATSAMGSGLLYLTATDEHTKFKRKVALAEKYLLTNPNSVNIITKITASEDSENADLITILANIQQQELDKKRRKYNNDSLV